MTLFSKSLPYIRQYLFGVLWTFIDSVGSQTLVIVYHFFLRTYAGQEIHGVIGCLFSLLYLSTAITNFGLDKSLAPFLEMFSNSKKTFTLFLLILAIQMFLIFGISVFFFLAAPILKDYLSLLQSLQSYLSPSLLFTLLVTFFFESLRKTLRTFLQLSFYFKETAFIELFGICANVLSVFVLFFYESLTIESVLNAHAVLCIAQTVLLSLVIHRFYKTLKDIPAPENTNLAMRMVKTRLYAWMLHCMSQLYSGNFLVPVCVMKFGISSASLLKIMTSISHWIALISRNVFGTTSNAVLAHLKSRSSATQKDAFHYLSFVANQALYCLIIFLLINGKKILVSQVTSHDPISWSLLYFMLFINFFEGFFVLYEKWYILEEDALFYVLLNALSLGALYLIVSSLITAPSILAAILSIRIVTFFALLIMSFFRWSIWPPLRPHPLPVVSTLLLSGIYYLLL